MNGDSGGPLVQYVSGRAVLIGITHGSTSVGNIAGPNFNKSIIHFLQFFDQLDQLELFGRRYIGAVAIDNIFKQVRKQNHIRQGLGPIQGLEFDVLS
ncbi:unnamed protein product [Medioppia subpectinata]|uniref:Peptidase S1 domain-containing protein n=1 Tax=Medioppia subpectinata TaxID=1979941 RepID=A0A7R9KFJ1_9ACAR|nr:unnamed protein product [Medioppia subpectinata]CAG2102273.1 unnamed protein product [Medioppia subpectinata]